MKNRSAILVLKNISKSHEHPAEKRAFEKAIAALEYCNKHNLTYYVERKYFGKMKDE